jgi:hypothetical protein
MFVIKNGHSFHLLHTFALGKHCLTGFKRRLDTRVFFYVLTFTADLRKDPLATFVVVRAGSRP